MILFNLIFFKDISDVSTRLSKHPLSIRTSTKKYQSSFKRNARLAYILTNPEVLSQNNQILAKKNFVSKQLGQNFLNSSWKQEVFLSLNNKYLNKYNVNLYSLNANKSKNVQKSLISAFSRSLFNGSIQAKLISGYNDSRNNLFSIQYIWSKNLKLQFLKINNIFKTSSYYKSIKSRQNIFNKNLSLNNIPLFTISNHLGQMVISEPPTDLNISKYTEPFMGVKSHYNQIYHGFFFANYKDAEEYLNYIKTYYSLEAKQLKIFTCNFSTFYNLINRFDHAISFKLIPDLQEVSQLIKKYRYNSKVAFHKKQSYGKNHFKGQPLYVVRNSLINVTDRLSQRENQKLDFLFLSYSDARDIFNKINAQTLDVGQNSMSILVYNLENFIQDQIKVKANQLNTFVVIPSKESYIFTKTYQLKKSSELLYKDCLNRISSINLWSKRIFWSLTSKKP